MLGEFIKKGRIVLATALMGRSTTRTVPLRLGGIADAENLDEAVNLKQLQEGAGGAGGDFSVSITGGAAYDVSSTEDSWTSVRVTRSIMGVNNQLLSYNPVLREWRFNQHPLHIFTEMDGDDEGYSNLSIFIDRQGYNGEILCTVSIASDETPTEIDHEQTPDTFIVPEGVSVMSFPVYFTQLLGGDGLTSVFFDFYKDVNAEIGTDNSDVAIQVDFTNQYQAVECPDDLIAYLKLTDTTGTPSVELQLVDNDGRAGTVQYMVVLYPMEILQSIIDGEMPMPEGEPTEIEWVTFFEGTKSINDEDFVSLGNLDTEDSNREYVVLVIAESMDVLDCQFCFSTLGSEYWNTIENGFYVNLPNETEVGLLRLGDAEQCNFEPPIGGSGSGSGSGLGEIPLVIDVTSAAGWSGGVVTPTIPAEVTWSSMTLAGFDMDGAPSTFDFEGDFVVKEISPSIYRITIDEGSPVTDTGGMFELTSLTATFTSGNDPLVNTTGTFITFTGTCSIAPIAIP